MKFILKLLKEILNRVSNLYSNESVDELLSAKVSKEDSDGAIESLAKSRKDNDDIVQGIIDTNKSYDEALTNVIKWQSYAASMQSVVDEDTAIQIAEEFEKAAEEYLKDPTVSKIWRTTGTAGSTISSSNPYYSTPPTSPVVDFTVTSASSTVNSAYYGSFSSETSQPVFLPAVKNAHIMFGGTKAYNFPIILPVATEIQYLVALSDTFDNFVFAPSATMVDYAFYKSTKYNRPVYFKKAVGCSLMLYGATSFNQSLSLPSATNCLSLLYLATSFNSTLDIPNATNCTNLCQQATSFNQPVYLPKCKTAANAFLVTSMNAANIAATLNSLPVWTDGASHVITFTRSPGIKSVSTTESFAVTDEDGTEYTLDNSPIFINDDDDQTLRKAVTLAVMKKGWTVEGGGDYTQVSYLGFTGTQYIDTGIVGDLDTSYEIVFDSDVVSSNYMVLFGSRESSNSRSISTMVYTSGWSILNDFGSQAVTRQNCAGFKVTTPCKVYNSKNNRSVYDYETNQTASVETSYTLSFTTPTNLFIGYKSSGYAEVMSNFSGRVYSCKIWQAGVLVRDLIPVVNTDGVASMYDKISRTVLPNAGTGAFEYEDPQST